MPDEPRTHGWMARKDKKMYSTVPKVQEQVQEQVQLKPSALHLLLPVFSFHKITMIN